MMHRRLIVPTIAAALILLSCQRPARARAYMGKGFGTAVLVFFVVGEVGLISSAATFGGLAAWQGHRGDRSNTLVAFGYISGGLNIVAGSLLVHYGRRNSTYLGLGITNLVLGVVCLGLSIWANTKPTTRSSNEINKPLLSGPWTAPRTVGLRMNLARW